MLPLFSDCHSARIIMYGIIIKVCKKPMTPSPSLSIHEATSFQENSRERSRKMKSIQKIYSQTKIISDLF